jgi:hypothetical protein
LKHGAYSARLQEERAREIETELMSAPWAHPMDALAAAEAGRLMALIERIDGALSDGRVEDRQGRPRALIEMRLRAHTKLISLLEAFGCLPRERASWTSSLTNRSAAQLIRERLDALDGE